MSDEAVTTRVIVADPAGGEVDLHFQEYWVERGGLDEVRTVRYKGSEGASPAPGVLEAFAEAETILICPSNPIASIMPILSVRGIREELAAHRDRVVGISPIVGGAPVRGMADKLMAAAGYEVTAAGAARCYENLLAGWVIDERDRDSGLEIEATGVRVAVTDTMMDDDAKTEALARSALGLL